MKIAALLVAWRSYPQLLPCMVVPVVHGDGSVPIERRRIGEARSALKGVIIDGG